MQLSIFTTRIESLYAAYTPTWGVVSYGDCREEALNNLQDEVRAHQRPEAGEGTRAQ